MRTARRTAASSTASRTARTTTRTTGTGSAHHGERLLHRSLVVAGLTGLGVPLMAATALAAPGLPPVQPLSAAATVTTSATGTSGATAGAALQPLRSTAGTVRLCPGSVTSLGVSASAGSLTVVRPRVASTGWATGTASAAHVSTASPTRALSEAFDTSATASAGPRGVTADVDAPAVSYVVGSTRVVLPPLSLQTALSSVREDVRTAAGFLPTVTAAVDARSRGAAVTVDGPLSLAADRDAAGCVDLDWQLLG